MKAVTIILGILTIVLGIFCVFRPGVTSLSLGWMLGLLLLLYGIVVVANYFAAKIGTGWDVLFGILAIIGGGVLLFNRYSSFVADRILIYIWGIFMMTAGILRIVSAFKMKREKLGGWGMTLAFGILSVIVGIIVVGHPLLAMISVGYIIAFGIISQGINMISFATLVKSKQE